MASLIRHAAANQGRFKIDAIDLRDSDVPSEIRPRTECLIDFLDRVLPHWYDQIGPICKPTRWS